MKFCDQCGVELNNGANFCSACGNHVGTVELKQENNLCEKCGTQLKKDDLFCYACGEPYRTADEKDRKNPRRTNIPKKLTVISIISIVIIVASFLLITRGSDRTDFNIEYSPEGISKCCL